MNISNRDFVVRRDLFDLLEGDWPAASLLSQIVWWFTPKKEGGSKLRVKRDGLMWIAKTRNEWMVECGLTRNQYDRVISMLKRKKMIEVRVMKFAGIAMNHIHVSSENLVVWKPDIPFTGNQTSPSLETSHPYTEITSEITTDEGSEINLTDKKMKLDKYELIKMKKKEDMNAAAIMKKMENKPTFSLEAHWKSRMSMLYEKFQCSLGSKERGQLSLLSKKLGAQAKVVVDYVLNDWQKFGYRALQDFGLKNYPDKPNVGFLLMYHATALSMMGEKENVQLIATKPPAPLSNEVEVVYDKKNILGEKNYKPYKPSPEELAEILAE